MTGYMIALLTVSGAVLWGTVIPMAIAVFVIKKVQGHDAEVATRLLWAQHIRHVQEMGAKSGAGPVPGAGEVDPVRRHGS